MKSKFYYFKGNFDEQAAKLKELSDLSGSIRNYADCMTLNLLVEDNVADIADPSVVEVKVGSARWRYFFELAREHLIWLLALDGGDLKEVERIAELKIGKPLKNESEFYSCAGTKETSADFELRILRDLGADANGVFFHKSKKFSFQLAKPKE